MKLTYRGVSYEHNPLTLEPTADEISGKYRGGTWKHSYPRHIPQTQPTAELKYRGVSYYVGDPLQVEFMIRSKQHSDTVKAAQVRQPEVGQPEKKGGELAKTHLTNIRRNLEHRLLVATEKRDENLIRLLEDEARQIA
ncbi:DUF4278 domain-containing protein [Brasilonema sp. UFV-L1]|uniref:DUF4278 domain-containing protein n=1 Tax=Brasilonema sp. UFV-L1 TaxID=2234130 RepID=UPI00145F7B71|nr:DUF4278 domain-containing protein [Brasilonema sp. UFV-L1]NMG09867.1 hypothetical protein [Brasilonema sp. UFV-L1]